MILLALLPTNIEIIIVVIAMAYALGTFTLQRKLSNPKKAREIQRKMKAHSKILNEMTKNGATREQIMQKQSEIMPLMTESMKNQMKSAIVVLPIFLIIYSFALPYFATSMGFVKDTVNFVIPNMTYQSFFFSITFIIGIIMTAFILIYDRKKSNEENAIEANIQQSQ